MHKLQKLMMNSRKIVSATTLMSKIIINYS